MTSSFERVYQTDPSRESDVERERRSIELSDNEYLAKSRPKVKISEMTNMEFAEHIGKLMEKDDTDAKSARKSPAKKAKKNDRQSHNPAVARIQKKL